MKKSSEDLSRAQEATDERQELLEKGKIRLAPIRAEHPPAQKEDQESPKKTGT